MSVQKEYEQAKHNLAKALQGVSAEQRAEVLSLVVDYEIDPDSEFFLIFVAIGHLKSLIERAPDDWRELFNSIYKELDKCINLSLRQGTNFEEQTKTIKLLAESSNNLADQLIAAQQTSQQQQEQSRKLTESLSGTHETFSELNELLKGLLKILLSRSLCPDLERLREMARNGEEVNPEKIPKTVDWAMARIYLYQDIANYLAALLKPHLRDLTEEIKNQREPTSVSIASPPPATRKSASFAVSEMAAIVVGVLSVLTLNGWLGVQIGNLQARSDPGYQQAMEIWQLNQAQLKKARAEGRKKSTIWLVPDHLR
jgi:uncharacterized coiled-coil protein SlyX